MTKNGELGFVNRFCVNIALFVSIFVCPWWITLLLNFIILFYFKNHYEYFFVTGAIGLLYFNVPGHSFIFIAIPIFSIILFYLSGALKSRLSGY